MKHFICLLLLSLSSLYLQAGPIQNLLERIAPGASKQFIIERQERTADFFEIDSKGDKVVIRGNTYVNIAAGIHWYLKYHAGVLLTWNHMKTTLPERLPLPKMKEYHETEAPLRYCFNYCTFSYTMAFWDWERWEKEIDWMALHGINLPLAITGAECVWYHLLKKSGYSVEEINQFIAGPGFLAWWLMNNLEGWGGPNPESWYRQQTVLQQRIVKRMREFGIQPVLPGYSGMVPSNAKEKLGLAVADPGKWCSYQRPAFLQPTDPNFQKMAKRYYAEMNRLFGRADYYSMDPFHEGGSVEGVDLDAAGRAIMQAMKANNPKAVWVAQAWQNNPREAMIKPLKEGDLLVLDLFSESRPQWGDAASTWYRKEGFGQHDWIYCMLLNYGGNVGLHGKMQHVIDEYYKAKESRFSSTLKGVGMTMEGSENNPVMFELLSELPWRESAFKKEEWLKGYVQARYGVFDQTVYDAWLILSRSVYNCPVSSTQQGTHESIFCARPSRDAYQSSSWSEMSDYYDPNQVIDAAGLMVSAAERFRGNDNFEYDLVDIVRQAVSEKGRLTQKVFNVAYDVRDKELFERYSTCFLELILLQDRLLGTRPEFKVGRWIEQARRLGQTPEEKALYEWNARVQITTWGNRTAADQGGLRDYAHKEWNGVLRDLYYQRWAVWFKQQQRVLEDSSFRVVNDFYGMEEQWANDSKSYSSISEGDPITVAQEVFNRIR